MNENDFECLAKTRVNTPPMAKMTDDERYGSCPEPEVGFEEISLDVLATPVASIYGISSKFVSGSVARIECPAALPVARFASMCRWQTVLFVNSLGRQEHPTRPIGPAAANSLVTSFQNREDQPVSDDS